MNNKVRYAVLAVLTLGVLLVLAFTFTTPLLYSLGNDLSVSSRFHENVDALKVQSQNSTTDIYPELQEMIDSTGPISLMIEIHDLEGARRYLELLGKNQASIKNLIVKLDMEDSEIQELEKNTALQKQILESLLNTTVSLDALQSMEIQYYSESSQEMRIPFRLRGNELRKKVQGLNQRYRNATEKVVATGTKLGLDVAKNKESGNQVEKIIQKIEQPEIIPVPVATTPKPEVTPTLPVATTPKPEVTPTLPVVTTPKPEVTPTLPIVTTPKPEVTPTLPVATTPKPEVSPTVPIVTTPKPEVSPTVPVATTPKPEVSPTVPVVTTPKPEVSPTVPIVTTPKPGDNRVSLVVKPETGKYKENIGYSGISLNPLGNTSPRSESNPIKVYIDEQPVSTAISDKYGFYTAQIPVERLQPGNHTVYSQSPTSRSDNRTLTVTPVDSVTYLMASNPDQQGNVVFGGYIEANNAPVTSAPVQINWDQSHTLTTKTDEDGYFEQKIQLSPGRHIVVANFSGEGSPINPSESTPLIVDISYIRSLGVENGQVWLLISFIGICILVLGGAIFYLRRIVKGTTPPIGSFENAGITPDQTENDLRASGLQYEHRMGDGWDPGYESLFQWYSRLLKEQGLSAASRGVYEQLAGRIANEFHLKPYQSLTARELSRNCRGKSYCGTFSRFVAIYERIRYGGKSSVEEQAAFETALTSTDEQMPHEKQ